MKYYEITYLISPDIAESELKTCSEKINSFIKDKKGIVFPSFDIGKINKINLAFPIKNKNQAYLNTLFFYLKPSELARLKEKLKSEKQILRYLILNKKPVSKAMASLKSTKKKSVLPELSQTTQKKVEIKEIDKKIEEILGK